MARTSRSRLSFLSGPRRTARLYAKSKIGMIGLVIILFFVILALFSPELATNNPVFGVGVGAPYSVPAWATIFPQYSGFAVTGYVVPPTTFASTSDLSAWTLSGVANGNVTRGISSYVPIAKNGVVYPGSMQVNASIIPVNQSVRSPSLPYGQVFFSLSQSFQWTTKAPNEFLIAALVNPVKTQNVSAIYLNWIVSTPKGNFSLSSNQTFILGQMIRILPTVNTLATTQVGAYPSAVAYDSSKGEIFVTNYGSNTVSVISDTNNKVVANVSVGNGPVGVAYDSSKGEIFVTNLVDRTVSVISDTNNKVVAKVSVGRYPRGVAYDSSKGEIFVTNYGSNTVSVISDTNNTVIAKVHVGTNPLGIAYDPTKGEVFVANSGGGGTVSVISDTTNTVVATVNVGANPLGVAYNSATGRVFVTYGVGHGTVSMISDTKNAVVATVSVGSSPRALAYDSIKGEVFVANSGTGTISVISDPRFGQWKWSNVSDALLPLSGLPAFARGSPDTVVFNKVGTYTLTLQVMGIPNGDRASISMDIASMSFHEQGNAYGLLGTDNGGRDVWSQLVWGSQISLMIGILSGVGAVAMGTLAGLAAGYLGGLSDEIISRVTDFFLVLPFLPLLIILVLIISQNDALYANLYSWIILVFIILSWPSIAKIIRSQVLSVKERQYVEASRALGGGTPHIIRRHILPNVMGLVYSQIALNVSGFILLEAALDYLAVSLHPIGVITWGAMLTNALPDATANSSAGYVWWWFLPPGIAIAALSLAFVLVGFALDSIFNPRLRAR